MLTEYQQSAKDIPEISVLVVFLLKRLVPGHMRLETEGYMRGKIPLMVKVNK